MLQHGDCRYLWIYAELLGQVAQQLANSRLILQHVYFVQMDLASIRILQGRYSAHQCTFACAVRSQEAEHAVADGQGKILECLDAIRIGLR